MKKIVQVFFAFTAAFILSVAFNIQPIHAQADVPQEPSNAPSYSVVFNGSRLDLTLPIITEGNRLMYPFRECLESMGAAVSWNPETRTASGKLGSNSVDFIVDMDFYLVNGAHIKMDAGVKTGIRDGKTYIPLRYAAESLGFNVSWDGSTQTVIIDSVASGDLTKKQLALLTEYQKRFPDYEITMRASDGAIFMDNHQHTFPGREGLIGNNLQPTFKTNKIKTGSYPASLSRNDYVTFAAFNDALVKIDSNHKLQNDRSQLANLKFAVKGGDSVVWNNGIVSVGLFMMADTGSDNAAKLSLRAWHTFEKDLATGNPSYEMTEICYTTELFEINTHSALSSDFAKELWDAIALLDTAVSISDIQAAKAICTAPA